MNIFENTFVLLLESNIKKYKDFNKDIYMQELEIIRIKNGECTHKCPYCNRILSSLLNYHKHIENLVCRKEAKNTCSSCGKYFSRKSNYDYHINKEVCTKNKKHDLLDMIKLNENGQENNLEINHPIQQNPNTNPTPQNPNTNSIQQITNNTTNNNTTNNTDNSITNNTANTANTTNIQTQNNNNQQNIIIAVSGKQDIEEVCKQVSKLIPFRYTKYKPSVKDLISYFNNPNKAIQQIIINEHFNPDKPEQMNIHNTNCRSNRMQVFDEDENGSERWITRDKTDVCDDLYEKSVNEMFFAKHNLKLKGYRVSAEKEKTMNDKIHQLETNKKLRKEYMDKISNLTWDYKNVVQTNRKNLIKN